MECTETHNMGLRATLPHLKTGAIQGQVEGVKVTGGIAHLHSSVLSDEMIHGMAMAHSDLQVSRSPPVMFPTKSSATESTCMDKSALSLSMSASFSHSEGNASVTDRQRMLPSEETTCYPRLPQPPEAWVCARPEEPVAVRRRISGRVVPYDEIDAYSVALSSVSDEAAGKGSRERSARGTKGGLAQDFYHERRLINEPAPAGQIPRPSLSLIESDLEQLYAAARAPHAWNHSCEPELHDTRLVEAEPHSFAQREDLDCSIVPVLRRDGLALELTLGSAAMTGAPGFYLPRFWMRQDSRSFSFSEAGQESRFIGSWRSVQPHEGSLPCTVRTSSASCGRKATRDVEHPPHHPCSVQQAEEQSQASFGSRPSSQRSSRTGLREDLAKERQDQVHATRSRQALVQRQSGPSTSRYVDSQLRVAETDSMARAARPDQVESNPSEQASRDRHSRLPPPPERWLEAQSFAEPGRQLRRLAKRRKALAKELRARLHHMEQHCGLLSEDYRRLAGLDTELHKVVATLQAAFATEHEAMMLSVNSRDS
ncbi:unnamed protein product [Symbiodinium sp. KB8]|nr:unnamed protein product [Symbiodinium sp. KB8]